MVLDYFRHRPAAQNRTGPVAGKWLPFFKKRAQITDMLLDNDRILICRPEVDSAQANGEGFLPICGDNVAVVLQPVKTDGTTGNQVTIAQVTFAEINVECTPIYQQETAGGYGDMGWKQGWGMYFSYCQYNGD